MESEILILYQLNIVVGKLENINNFQIIKDILKSSDKLSDNEQNSKNEDTKIGYTEDVNFLTNCIIDQFKKKTNINVRYINCWGHIHEYNQSTNLHDHCSVNDYISGNHFSAVYYLQIPEKSGKIVFEYPVSRYSDERFSIDPEVGKFIIFPSTLKHFVTKNKSEDKRISISFNFNVVH